MAVRTASQYKIPACSMNILSQDFEKTNSRFGNMYLQTTSLANLEATKELPAVLLNLVCSHWLASETASSNRGGGDQDSGDPVALA
jgi:hypothetical protein